MSKFFRFLKRVFKSYTKKDRYLSFGAALLVVLMFAKLHFFPYGFSLFGESEIYTEGIVSETGIQNLNPLFVAYNEADREVSQLLFSGLMKYDPSDQTVIDDMANMEVSEDRTEYIFTLRPGIKWHDEEPVTIDDVYFTYHDIIQHPSFANQILKTNFNGVEITKVDEKTIKFKLSEPNIFFLTNFTVGILPKHLLEDVDPYDIAFNEFNKNPIGTGPYKISEPIQDLGDGKSQITLERNINYHGELSEVEFMRFKIYPNMQSLLEEIDLVNSIVKIPGEYLDEIKEIDRFTIRQYELPQYLAVYMNTDSKILSNRLVRLGLQKAINKDELVKMFNDKVRVDTPLMELDQEEWTYQHSFDEANGALKEAGFNYLESDEEKTGTRYNTGIEVVEEKVEEENEDVIETEENSSESEENNEEEENSESEETEESENNNESSEEPEENSEESENSEEEKGDPLVLNLIARSHNPDTPQFDDTIKTVNFLEDSWEQIGVDVVVEFLPEMEFKNRIMAREYDLLLVGQNLGYNLDTYSFWHSTQAKIGQNFSNYKSFQSDQLIEEIRTIFNFEEREEKLRELAEKLRDDVPAIFLYRPLYFYASDNKVEGIQLDGLVFPSDRFLQIKDWKFTQ